MANAEIVTDFQPVKKVEEGSATDFRPVPQNDAVTTEFTPVSEYRGPDIPTISTAPPLTLGERFWSTFKNPDEERAKAMNSLAISDSLKAQGQDVRPSQVYNNYDSFTKSMGMRGTPTTGELIGAMVVPAITAGLMTAPIATMIGLAGFQALSEAESAAVNFANGEKYHIFQNKGLSELLPADVSTLTKDFVDILDFVAKGMVVGAGIKYAPSIRESITKDIIDTYNMPKTIYIDPVELKAELQTGGVIPAAEMEIYKGLGLTGTQVRQALKDGVHIEVPAERVTTISDKPWFAKVKGVFKIDPQQQSVSSLAGKPTQGPAGLLEGGKKQPPIAVPPGAKEVPVMPPESTLPPVSLSEESLNRILDQHIASDQPTSFEELYRQSKELPHVEQHAKEGTALALPSVSGGDVVSGLEVIDDIPNTSSIGASLNEYETIGIREVPMDSLTLQLSSKKNVVDLANAITASGKIKPLIVVYDSEGPYILEGSNRIDALYRLGKKSFPALVVLDTESLHGISEITKKVTTYISNEKGAVDPTRVFDLGKSVYDEGHKTYEAFVSRMKEVLRDVWDKVKDVMRQVYDAVLKFNKSLGETGSIGKPDKGAKKRIREITGQVKGKPTVTEPGALAAGMKKAERAGKSGFKAGVQAGIEKATAPDIETLKGRIARITGMKPEDPTLGEDVALKAAFNKAEQASRVAFRAGDKAGVEKEKERMKDIMRWKAHQEFRREELKGQVKEAKSIQEKSIGNIALDYQEKIKDMFSGIDMSTPTEATIERLQDLQDFIQREGVPLGISQRELNQLERLSKTPFKEMSIQARESLLDTARKLYDLGKLKRELQQNKEAREQAIALDKLVASTIVNLDPKVSSKEKPTYLDTTRVAYVRLSSDVLHSFRVADRVDGSKDYKGENARLIKEEMHAEIAAKNAANDSSKVILESIRAAGLDEIPEGMTRRINVVLMSEQGARSQVVELLKKYNMTEIPELTPQERRVMDIVRTEVGTRTDKIAAIYEKRENLKFPRVKNYFPIKYEGEFALAPSHTINQDRYRTKNVEQGFKIERIPGVKKVPREDFLAVAEEAIMDQEWYIRMQPLMDAHSALVRTPEYKAAAGELTWNWWKDQIDIVSRKGWAATAQSNPWLRKTRINLNQAVLGYKATAMLMQPFAVFDSTAYAMSHYGPDAAKDIIAEFSKAWINPKAAMKFVRQSPALKLRHAGEVAVEETLSATKGMKGIKKSFIEGSLKGLQMADVITAAGIEKGLLKILEKHGITNAKEEADFLMNVVSGSSEVTIRPHILARGEGMRTWFTFQTFFMNRWGIISEDIIRSGFKGNWKRKALGLLALSIMVSGGMAEDKARDLIYTYTTGRKSNISDESLLRTVLLYLPRQIPVFGNLFEKWGNAEPPLIRSIGKGTTGLKQLVEGKWVTGTEKVLEEIMTVMLGIPATAQLFDLLGILTEPIKKKEQKKQERTGGQR